MRMCQASARLEVPLGTCNSSVQAAWWPSPSLRCHPTTSNHPAPPPNRRCCVPATAPLCTGASSCRWGLVRGVGWAGGGGWPPRDWCIAAARTLPPPSRWPSHSHWLPQVRRALYPSEGAWQLLQCTPLVFPRARTKVPSAAPPCPQVLNKRGDCWDPRVLRNFHVLKDWGRKGLAKDGRERVCCFPGAYPKQDRLLMGDNRWVQERVQVGGAVHWVSRGPTSRVGGGRLKASCLAAAGCCGATWKWLNLCSLLPVAAAQPCCHHS